MGNLKTFEIACLTHPYNGVYDLFIFSVFCWVLIPPPPYNAAFHEAKHLNLEHICFGTCILWIWNHYFSLQSHSQWTQSAFLTLNTQMNYGSRYSNQFLISIWNSSLRLSCISKFSVPGAWPFTIFTVSSLNLQSQQWKNLEW